MNRIQSVQARTAAALKAERPTTPAPAYTACRAASERELKLERRQESAALMAAWRATALRSNLAHELLNETGAEAHERETWPAPASDLSWDCEVES